MADSTLKSQTNGGKTHSVSIHEGNRLRPSKDGFISDEQLVRLQISESAMKLKEIQKRFEGKSGDALGLKSRIGEEGALKISEIGRVDVFPAEKKPKDKRTERQGAQRFIGKEEGVVLKSGGLLSNPVAFVPRSKEAENQTIKLKRHKRVRDWQKTLGNQETQETLGYNKQESAVLTKDGETKSTLNDALGGLKNEQGRLQSKIVLEKEGKFSDNVRVSPDSFIFQKEETALNLRRPVADSMKGDFGVLEVDNNNLPLSQRGEADDLRVRSTGHKEVALLPNEAGNLLIGDTIKQKGWQQPSNMKSQFSDRQVRGFLKSDLINPQSPNRALASEKPGFAHFLEERRKREVKKQLSTSMDRQGSIGSIGKSDQNILKRLQMGKERVVEMREKGVEKSRLQKEGEVFTPKAVEEFIKSQVKLANTPSRIVGGIKKIKKRFPADKPPYFYAVEKYSRKLRGEFNDDFIKSQSGFLYQNVA